MQPLSDNDPPLSPSASVSVSVSPSLSPTLATEADLPAILELQAPNHLTAIGTADMKSEGFLTLKHDLRSLKQLHDIAPAVVIKNEKNEVVAYALTMLRECRQLIPDLEPMYSLFDQLTWKGRPLNDYRFYVMGQVCVARPYRGQGLFEMLYDHHKNIYGKKFELFVTEISVRNSRSLRAHEKVGFKPVHQYRDHLDEWLVVAWDWS